MHPPSRANTCPRCGEPVVGVVCPVCFDKPPARRRGTPERGNLPEPFVLRGGVEPRVWHYAIPGGGLAGVVLIEEAAEPGPGRFTVRSRMVHINSGEECSIGTGVAGVVVDLDSALYIAVRRAAYLCGLMLREPPDELADAALEGGIDLFSTVVYSTGEAR